MSARWIIDVRDDYAWSPAEVAQISSAILACVAPLPGMAMTVLELDGVRILDWPKLEANGRNLPDSADGKATLSMVREE